MDQERLSRYFFIVVLLIVLYLSIVVIRPFLTYIVLGLVLTAILYPFYKWLCKKVKNKNVAASIIVILVLLAIIMPLFYIITSLVQQAGVAYQTYGNAETVERFSEFITHISGQEVDVKEFVNNSMYWLKTNISSYAPTVVTSITDIFLGLFVLFFVMFYALKEGNNLYDEIKELIPLKKKYKVKLFAETKNMVGAVMYGQVITAIIQGGLGGLGFLLFGIPNPVLWGFIMIILSFLPIVGAPIIWIPAGIIQIVNGNYVSGIGILIYGIVVISQIDNFIRPKLISRKSKLHPAVVLVGVLGGLKVFGFVGLILGPLILAILMVLLRTYTEDFKPADS
ncbi:MAG: AI-2E family transporter [archaeon]